MRTYLRKIAALVVVVLVTSGFAVANNGPAEEIQNAVEVQAEAAQRQPGIALVARDKSARDKAVSTTPVLPTPSARTPVSPGKVVRSGNYSPWWSGKSSGTGRVLVVPAAEIKTEDILAITEDMSVMSRIFERNLERARIGAVPGDVYMHAQFPLETLLGRGRSGIQSIYLQGFGALFLTKVDFPLSPGPQAQEEKQTQEDEDVDPVWERTRIEMYEPEEARRRTTRTAAKPEEKYDAEKVANLKSTIITSLKHAANIRNLKPDESVVLTVTGGGGRATLVGDATSAMTKIFVVGSDGNTKIIEDMSPGGEAALFPTVLVMRAKKSDIDAFAKGDLDLDQFRQRVQVLACPYLGGEAGSGAFQAYKYTGIALPSSGPELDF